VVTAVAAFYLPVLAMCVVYYLIYLETEKRQRGLLYLQATGTGSSSCRRLNRTPTIEDDSIEMSSRRSTSVIASAPSAFVQSPTPLQIRVRLTTDASVSDHRRARRRATWRSLTRCLRCSGRSSTGEAGAHTPPRKSSYDIESTLPRPGDDRSTNDTLQ